MKQGQICHDYHRYGCVCRYPNASVGPEKERSNGKLLYREMNTESRDSKARGPKCKLDRRRRLKVVVWRLRSR